MEHSNKKKVYKMHMLKIKKAEEEYHFSEKLKKIVEWNVKNDFFKNQISMLEETKDFPIFAVSGFLLKAQLVEFELKQLISSLDLHMYFSNSSQILKKKTRTPKSLDDKILTLGKLKDEIEKFDGDFLKDLKANLSNLVGLRNKFVHKLFNPGSINEMIKNAESGLATANDVIKSIEDVNKFLKEHDPLNIKGEVGL